jgi:hypothetical protein
MVGESVAPAARGTLSEVTRRALWSRAAGRCEYAGCNKSLIGDLLSGAEDRNFGFVAHIVADEPGGPRGDMVRSPRLAGDINNLMLMCYVHHKLIDVDAVHEHPESTLVAMKRAHEARLEILAEVQEDRASHVLRYAARIGSHECAVPYEQVTAAMLPDRYPVEGRKTIDIEIRGTDQSDDEPAFWPVQQESLRRQFGRKVVERLESRDMAHLSVFAVAPQPLLVELGRLLGDIMSVDVYQLHREPKGWRWPADGTRMAFRVKRPERPAGTPVLLLALSASISTDRIMAVLGSEISVWAIEAEQPHNDAMKRRDDLAEFRRCLRSLFDEIKFVHGESALVHVFPALPVSAAVEVGRVWMPKADLPLLVYDQNRKSGGFVAAVTIASGATTN